MKNNIAYLQEISKRALVGNNPRKYEVNKPPLKYDDNIVIQINYIGYSKKS